MSDKVELPWADAPEWAVAAAMDQDQDWYWYGQKISLDQWVNSGEKITPSQPPAADWRKSLQFRPVDVAPKLPDGLPPLPEGWEYVGMGNAMRRREECLYFDPKYHSKWMHGDACAQNVWQHYARRKPSAERTKAGNLTVDVELSDELKAALDGVTEKADIIGKLADRGYSFRIDEEGITAWREGGDE